MEMWSAAGDNEAGSEHHSWTQSTRKHGAIDALATAAKELDLALTDGVLMESCQPTSTDGGPADTFLVFQEATQACKHEL
eukprot:1856298-Amphidinium_carterae.1